MVMECMKECNYLLEEASELHSNKEDLVPSDNQNKLLRPRIPFEVINKLVISWLPTKSIFVSESAICCNKGK